MKRNLFLVIILSFQAFISLASQAPVSGSTVKTESQVGGWMQASTGKSFSDLVKESVVPGSLVGRAGVVIDYDKSSQIYQDRGTFVGTKSGLNVLAHDFETGQYIRMPKVQLAQVTSGRLGFQPSLDVIAEQVPQVEEVPVKISSRWCGCFCK